MKTKLVKALRGAWKAGMILTLVFFLAVLFGCADVVSTRETDNPPLEDLSEELEKRILQDHFDTFIEPHSPPEWMDVDFWVADYYGTYNGYVILNIRNHGYYPDRMMHFVIAGVEFYFESLKIPMVWKDGQFYGYVYEPKYDLFYVDWDSGGTLRVAYDSGLLTQDDLRSIAGHINSEEDEEKPIIFEVLSAKTKKQILLDYFNYPLKDIWSAGDFKIEDYEIYDYFGTYNDYVMVGIGVHEEIIWNLNLPSPAVPPPRVHIADWWYYDIYYYEDIIAWKNGQLYKVADLYNNGNLTLDDLRNIASLNPAWKPISELRQEGK